MSKTVRDEPHSRLIAHSIAEFVLRCAEKAGAGFGHDYETLLLFLAISTRNTHNIMNDPELRKRYASYSEHIPPSLVTPISRLALSRSTGLPRETVRRKVARMIKLKMIMEDGRGRLRVVPELNEALGYVAVLEPQLINLRRLFSVLSETDIFDKPN